MRDPITFPGYFRCPQCSDSIDLDLPNACVTYFRGEPFSCVNCKKTMDYWGILVDHIRDNFMMVWAFGALGASYTMSEFTLRAGDVTTLAAAELGIPDNATLLSIKYTAIGDRAACFPLELHGNSPLWAPPQLPIRVYGRGSTAGIQTKVNCMVTWFARPDKDNGWPHLIEAYRAYSREKYERLIIPANVAAEVSISQAVHDALRLAGVAGRDPVDKFMSGRDSSYSMLLLVLLPLLADRFEFPRLPDQLRGSLNRLRKLRNEVAHGGAPRSTLERPEIAELLAASTLGFLYGRKLVESVSAIAT